ncbi:diguanylate cyclase [Fusibacter sp. JL216-2]|uniref:diguanylate cyclase n=1 Tax=Fusibacter sp. JL216-2 TaxID=3071453 RepID=UPI003D351C75
MNILHIERSKLIREMIHDVVEKLGHDYYCSNSYKDAFHILDNVDVDFIVTGLELADSTSDTLMDDLMASSHKDVPVIVLTSTDNMDIREKLFDMGVVDYIVKDTKTDSKLRTYIETFQSQDEVLQRIKEMSIAVLDDSLLTTVMVKNIFELHGVRNVDTYENAEDLFESNQRYSIYILDLVLPGMSGEEVLLKLRQKSRNSVIMLMSSVSNYKTVSNILNSGADDFIMKPFDASVFMARVKAHCRNYMLRKELEKANEDLAIAAITDGLTKVYNHKHIVGLVEDHASQAVVSQGVFSLLLLDIDNFKHVNDTYGHQVGDEVLFELARCMEQTLNERGIVGRYGGEEFLVVLPDVTLLEAKEIGHDIRKAIEALRFSEDSLKVTISGGGVTFNGQSQDTTDASCLINEADEKLYEAKMSGKNKIHYSEGQVSLRENST